MLGPGPHGEDNSVARLAADPVHARMVGVGVSVAANRAPLRRRAVVAPVLRRLWVAFMRTLFAGGVQEPRTRGREKYCMMQESETKRSLTGMQQKPPPLASTGNSSKTTVVRPLKLLPARFS